MLSTLLCFFQFIRMIDSNYTTKIDSTRFFFLKLISLGGFLVCVCVFCRCVYVVSVSGDWSSTAPSFPCTLCVGQSPGAILLVVFKFLLVVYCNCLFPCLILELFIYIATFIFAWNKMILILILIKTNDETFVLR